MLGSPLFPVPAVGVISCVLGYILDTERSCRDTKQHRVDLVVSPAACFETLQTHFFIISVRFRKFSMYNKYSVIGVFAILIA